MFFDSYLLSATCFCLRSEESRLEEIYPVLERNMDYCDLQNPLGHRDSGIAVRLPNQRLISWWDWIRESASSKTQVQVLTATAGELYQYTPRMLEERPENAAVEIQGLHVRTSKQALSYFSEVIAGPQFCLSGKEFSALVQFQNHPEINKSILSKVNQHFKETDRPHLPWSEFVSFLQTPDGDELLFQKGNPLLEELQKAVRKLDLQVQIPEEIEKRFALDEPDGAPLRLAYREDTMPVSIQVFEPRPHISARDQIPNHFEVLKKHESILQEAEKLFQSFQIPAFEVLKLCRLLLTSELGDFSQLKADQVSEEMIRLAGRGFSPEVVRYFGESLRALLQRFQVFGLGEQRFRELFSFYLSDLSTSAGFGFDLQNIFAEDYDLDLIQKTIKDLQKSEKDFFISVLNSDMKS